MAQPSAGISVSPSKHLKSGGSPTNAGGGSPKSGKPLVRQILMRENAKGYMSKAHLYVPQHDTREMPGEGHQLKKNDLYSKMIIKERKEENDSSDLDSSSNSSR